MLLSIILLAIGSWFSSVFAVRIVKGSVGGYLPHCLVATAVAIGAPYLIDWLALAPPASWMLSVAATFGGSFVGLLVADTILGA
jgi:hypothetical protein